MGYISNFLSKRKAIRIVRELSQYNRQPLKALPLLVKLSHIIYDSEIAIARAEGILISMHHRDVEMLSHAIKVARFIIAKKSNPVLPNIDNPAVPRRLMDLCQVNSDGSYIYPDRLIPIVLSELEKLNYNLQEIDESNASYNYYERLVKYIIKDVHALAVCIYGEKYNNG